MLQISVLNSILNFIGIKYVNYWCKTKVEGHQNIWFLSFWVVQKDQKLELKINFLKKFKSFCKKTQESRIWFSLTWNIFFLVFWYIGWQKKNNLALKTHFPRFLSYFTNVVIFSENFTFFLKQLKIYEITFSETPNLLESQIGSHFFIIIG